MDYTYDLTLLSIADLIELTDETVSLDVWIEKMQKALTSGQDIYSLPMTELPRLATPFMDEISKNADMFAIAIHSFNMWMEDQDFEEDEDAEGDSNTR